MTGVVVQYPLQDVGVHQRAIEERGGHACNSREYGTKQVGPLFPGYRITGV